jgi:hypothetical protein
VIALKSGWPVVWCETKKVKDMKRKGQTADDQAAFGERAIARGEIYVRATSIQDVQNALDAAAGKDVKFTHE